MLDDLNTGFRDYANHDDLLTGLDRFSHQAYDIISSSRSRQAFDVNLEPPAFADRFGDHAFGKNCLLDCRLVQVGVRFVPLNFGGWDTHQKSFTMFKDRLLPQLDLGVSALLTTLPERGLLCSTAVQMCGEFGRTPKVSVNAGRERCSRYRPAAASRMARSSERATRKEKCRPSDTCPT